ATATKTTTPVFDTSAQQAATSQFIAPPSSSPVDKLLPEATSPALDAPTYQDIRTISPLNADGLLDRMIDFSGSREKAVCVSTEEKRKEVVSKFFFNFLFRYVDDPEWLTGDELDKLGEEMDQTMPLDSKLMNVKHGEIYEPSLQEGFLFLSAVVRIVITYCLKTNAFSPEKLLRIIGFCRRYLAIRCGHQNIGWYGEWRLENSRLGFSITTPLEGAYEHYRKLYEDENIQAPYSTKINLVTGQFSYGPDYPKENEVRLTLMHNDFFGKHCWHHINLESLEKLLPYIYKKMEYIRANSTPSKEWRKEIIMLHYLLAHATPFCRGSSWAAEIIIESFLAMNNLKLGKKVEGRSYDCDAYLYTWEKYLETYPDFIPLDSKKTSILATLPKPF
ncbi:MAG TPA: hypothetical protein VIH61_01680, partial [Waddliaceae bacterium]